METMTTSLNALAAHGGGPWQDGGGGPPFVIFPLFWLLLIGGVIAFAVLGRRRREAFAGRRSGMRLLAERYADGSIDEDEYRARRSVLRERK